MERRLANVLSDFARTLITDFPIQSILDHLVLQIVQVLPVSAAGVTLIEPGLAPRYVAASDTSALAFEQLQTELGEGPCVVAYHSGVAVAVPNLGADSRFPTFAARAREQGLRAVFTFPMRHGDHRLGALDLYRTTRGPMSTKAMAAAQTLADVAAAYVLNAQARVDLQDSLDRIRASSLHDPLTGLPNRALFVQRLEHAILRCRRSGKLVAILFADLDRFKEVNDNLGHHIGDELLTAVGERLTGLLRPGDTLARMSGDEFIILCEELNDASQVEALARRVNIAFVEPFSLSEGSVQITASVGIAFAGRGEDVPEQVIHDADTAMYQAKRGGGGRHAIIDPGTNARLRRRASLYRDLQDALAKGELRNEYQPIVATATGHVTGVEQLLRWSHPTLGLIPPLRVIPIAEQAGLIVPIGRWVLERACLDLHRWREAGQCERYTIAVNVSVHQLMAPGFVAMVADVLSATQTRPALVTLEITENVFIHDSERALLVLNDLKHIGVLLALDDFGTGYSSLAYLKQFPVDIVKIDQSFIADIDRDPTARHITNAVVGLAHNLGILVVAEGVETTSQHDQVAALCCDFYQGFHFAAPAPADQLDTLMARRPACGTVR